MKPKFQADADLNEDIVTGVRRRTPEIDFQTATEANLSGLADENVLEIAAREDRILVTHDRKTMPKHFARFIQKQNSPGVLIISQKLEIGTAIEEIDLIWTASEAEEYVNTIRRLPFDRLFPLPQNHSAVIIKRIFVYGRQTLNRKNQTAQHSLVRRQGRGDRASAAEYNHRAECFGQIEFGWCDKTFALASAR